MSNQTAFDQFPIIETDRLILRQPDRNDLEDIYEVLSHEEVAKYVGVARFQSMAEAEMELRWYQDLFEQKQGLRWAVSDRSTGKFLGSCGYKNYHAVHNKAEVGYDLNFAWWNKGIMSEALAPIIAYGFSQMNLNRMEADADTRNTASIHLLQKFGFQIEGIHRETEYENGMYIDLVKLSLLRREYEKNS
ncbi:GNAT family N-acetyltransferase [Brevibacillus sp. 179-C9.3 HS]|uniref:GNAT family N-acetyltransferase n=1 Tax=unclassified Brevibacillus TaxID=2684853 RepID=UPI0039A2EDC7